MEPKEIKINCPEGYEIDEENSTFDCIKFKPIVVKKWRDNDALSGTEGFYIDAWSNICPYHYFLNIPQNYKTFATEKQAKSALAMARISQIMAHDKRFGGVVTDKEWRNNNNKYIISRKDNKIIAEIVCTWYCFLAFHTKEQRNLFMKENEDLIKDYFMLD